MNSGNFVHKRFQNKLFKITVEEVDTQSDVQKFIATFWRKDDCLELDRSVFEFETYGGAVDKAFDLLVEEI